MVQQVLKSVPWRALQRRGSRHHNRGVASIFCCGGGAHCLVQACEEEAAECSESGPRRVPREAGDLRAGLREGVRQAI